MIIIMIMIMITITIMIMIMIMAMIAILLRFKHEVYLQLGEVEAYDTISVGRYVEIC